MAIDARIPLMGQQVDTATPLAALANGMAEKQRYDQQVAIQADETQYQRGQDAEKMAMLKEQTELAKAKAEWDNADAKTKHDALQEIMFTGRLKALNASDPAAAQAFALDPKNHKGEHAKEMAALFIGDKSEGKSTFNAYADMTEKLAQQIGAIEMPKGETTKVLSPGQIMVDTAGNKIAEGNTKPPAGMTAVVSPTTGETTFVNTKPMPPSIAKQQDELIGDLNIAKNIDVDLKSIIKGLNEGAVNLGPINNIGYKIENSGYAGESSPQSRNAANLLATLQKQRNDSLRLNKGTQTEFDAQRAWSELLGADEKNPSLPKDNKLLASGLARIAEYNARSAQEKNIRIDTIRSEYGKDPLDMAKIGDVKPSFTMEGNGKSGQAPAGVDQVIWEHMKPEERALFQ